MRQIQVPGSCLSARMDLPPLTTYGGVAAGEARDASFGASICAAALHLEH